MPYKASADSRFLPLQFNKHLPRNQSWWAPVWRGLVVEPNGKHYRGLHTAVWLYLYLIIHADRKSGRLFRRVNTIALEMGVNAATIRRWMSVLVKGGYVVRSTTGRALQIEIQRWKRLRPRGGG